MAASERRELQPTADDREEAVAGGGPVPQGGPAAGGGEPEHSTHKLSRSQVTRLDLERFKRCGERSGLLVAEKLLFWSSEEMASLMDTLAMFKDGTGMTTGDLVEVLKFQARGVSCTSYSILCPAHALSGSR